MYRTEIAPLTLPTRANFAQTVVFRQRRAPPRPRLPRPSAARGERLASLPEAARPAEATEQRRPVVGAGPLAARHDKDVVGVLPVDVGAPSPDRLAGLARVARPNVRLARRHSAASRGGRRASGEDGRQGGANGHRHW